MALYICEEFNLEGFNPWSGAVSRYEEIEDLGIMKEAQEYIEEMFDGAEVVTTTEINDLLWFGMDNFIQDYKEDEDEEE